MGDPAHAHIARSGRDLVVLGTSCAAPTRSRNQNGYLLRWGVEDVLFDPGEGAQRQLSLAGASSRRISHICISHLHGDHCLGLPGMLERLAGEVADGTERDVPVHFPASGLDHIDRLCRSTIGPAPPAVLDPVDRRAASEGVVVATGAQLQITARSLDHVVDALGWRVEVPPAAHLVPERLAAAGVVGEDIGRLVRDGSIDVDGRHIERAPMSDVHPGQAAAVIMDTRWCENAVALAEGVDLLLCEATYLESEAALAHDHGHLTARGAASIAREAGVRLLVLTHFSSRYDSADGHRREAERVFPNVVTAEDLDVIAVPDHERGVEPCG